MAFFILLIIQIALFVLSSYLNKPDLEDAKPAGLGDFQVPTASETRAVPILWGTRDIKGPNVIWYGDLRIVKITKKVSSGFSSSTVTVGYRYFIGMDLLLCYGPLDRIVRLQISDRTAFSGSIGPFSTTPEEMFVNKPGLLGGKEKGGGVRGRIDIYGGLPDQEVSSYLVNRGPGGGDPDLVPAYVDIAHAVAKSFEVGESPNIGAYVFRASRFPNNLGLTGANHIVNGTVDDGDANPAEMIYELMHSNVFGLAMDVSKFNAAEFVSVGNALADEGMGGSMIIDRQQRASEILKNILELIDGVLYEDSSGVFRLRLVRDDYGPVSGLDLLDESNVLEVKSFSRGSWSETQNHMNVKYADRGKDNIETGAMSQDLANFRTTNQENRIEKAMPAAAAASVAAKVAERELFQLSFPMAKVRLVVNRVGQKFRPGDVFRWSWERYGITDMVLRIMSIELGDILDGRVEIECVQDVFGVADTIFQLPKDTGWTPVDLTATAFTFELVRSVPRMYLNLTYANSGELDPELGQRIHSMAVRPSGAVTEFEQFVDEGGGAGYIGEVGHSTSVTPSGTLDAAYSAATNAIDAAGFTLEDFEGAENLEDLTDGSLIASGFNLALIPGAAADGSEDEIIGWESFVDNEDGTVDFAGIHRGLMDTVPRDHALGARVYFFSDGQAVSSLTYGETQVISVKHQAETVSDDLDIASASALGLTFPDRLRRPHHPVDVTINSTRIQQVVNATADLDIDWLHRTNDESEILDQDTGSSAPQDAEVEYDLEFEHGVTGASLRSETRVSPAPDWLTYLYTQANLQSDTGQVGDFPLRMFLKARYSASATVNPANLESLQESEHLFSVDMGGATLNSLDLDGATEYARTNSGSRGYANRWTWEIWVKWSSLGGGAETIAFYKPTSGNANRIELSVGAATASSPFTVQVWNSSGTLIKDFDFGSIPSAGVWTQIALTFDGDASGDPLLVYQDGADVTGSATLNTDNTGTQTNGAGHHTIGVDTTLASGFAPVRTWAWGVWNRPLATIELVALYNGGNGDAVNRRFDFGNYAGMADNMHLWDFRNASSGGADHGNDSPAQAGSLQDIFAAGVNVDGSDLVSDTP